MRVILTTDHRYSRTPDGKVWTPTTLPYAFWCRYLDVFDEVRVLARVRKVAESSSGWRLVEGKGVSVESVPDFEGPLQYIRDHSSLMDTLRRAVAPGDAVIIRVPSHFGSNLSDYLKSAGCAYALEVIGNPYEALAPGAMQHPLRGLFRAWFTRKLTRQCREATAIAYVTEAALQRRYPPNPDAFSTYYSDAELTPEAFADSPRSFTKASGPFQLITVGNLQQMVKAPDVLIDAVALCQRKGIDLRLTILGDGKHRPELEDRVRRLGIAERVQFRGLVPAGEQVRRALDDAHLFVLPSRTEGLPRALLEAMARGLPCVASDVGGIVELLPPEDRVPPGNPIQLAHKICEVLSSPDRMVAMAKRNLEKAGAHRTELLTERRKAFYMAVRERTQQSQPR